MDIRNFALQLAELKFIGKDLHRPESVIAERDGTLWVSNERGIVTRIDPDGTQTLLGHLTQVPNGLPDGTQTLWNVSNLPNGLAMATDGSLYNANFGDGRVYKVYRDGSYEVILDQIDGKPLGAPNFVFVDSNDRLWISISTREPVPRALAALASPRPDGYIILIDKSGPRIVGGGIYFANEIRLDAEEKYLYVAETMQNRMLRFPVNKDGSLGEKEVFGPETLGFGAYLDGFAFDAEGNIWVTTIFRNGLMIITPDGDAHTVFEDPVHKAIKNMVAKVDAGTLTFEDLSACAGPRLQLPTSVAFGGPNLKTVYMGSTAMPHLVSFQSPTPGLPMRHWK